MAELWSITAYFNPCRYRSRLENYRRFRAALQTPLLTVELAFDGRFELEADAAEILVRRRGGDVVWQKERLLNIALDALPAECTAIAWLDCDVLFSRRDWPRDALRALERWPLLQPFATARDQLGRASSTLGAAAPSWAAAYRGGTPLEAAFAYDADDLPRGRLSAPGFAWAARRDLIAAARFYDACILGAGDRALLRAATGNLEGEIAARMPSPSHARHYRQWALPFHRAVGGRIGFVPGEVVHLWHGDFRDRQYRVRFDDFGRFDFDPTRDIALDEQQCWRWASAKPALHDVARRLFAARHEDGRSAPAAAAGARAWPSTTDPW